MKPANKLFLRSICIFLLGCASISVFAFQEYALKRVSLSKQIFVTGLDDAVASLSRSEEKGGDRLLFRSEAPGDAGVFIFETNGEFEMRLEIPGNHVSIGGIARYAAYGVYLVSGMADDLYHIWVFSDQSGRFLGKGYVASGDGWVNQPAFFHQFIPVGQKLFVTDYAPDTSFNEPVLKEIRLSAYRDGYRFEQVGEAFSRNLEESRLFGGNFSNRWIVPTEHEDGTLCVVDQLQPRVWVYSRDFDRNFKQDYRRPLKLEHRVFPLDDYNNHPPVTDIASLQKWYYRFSMVQGFYRLDDDRTLIGYSGPNMDHPWYNGTDATVDAGDMSPFFLHLAFLDKHFKTKATFDIPGHFLLGVDGEGQILVWNGTQVGQGPPGTKFAHDITVSLVSPRQFERRGMLRAIKDWFASR